MKKVFYSLIALAAMLFLAGSLTFAHQTTQATQGQWFCPWTGNMPCMQGQGMHGPMHGRMMQHGPMQGQSMQRGMMQHGRSMQQQRTRLSEPLTVDQAKTLVENYLKTQGNPALKLGKLTEQKDSFVAEIVNKAGSVVNKFEIDKYSGWFRSIR